MITFNTLKPINNSGVSFKKYNRCRVDIFFNAQINWDGRVVECTEQGLYGEQRYIGDLKKQELREIWKNPHLQELRILHYKKDFMNISDCKKCFVTQNNFSKAYNPKIVLPK
jgi:MoaA/NifB/PqqE/SkfB family radical SAM enzyme